MTLDEAIAVLNAKRHRGSDQWFRRPYAYGDLAHPWHDSSAYLTDWEAVAVAEKYQAARYPHQDPKVRHLSKKASEELARLLPDPTPPAPGDPPQE